jgi:hypothetical protein
MAYKGYVVELPIGKDGFTGTRNLSETLPTQLIQAMNVEYSDGPMRKEGGSVKYNATAITGDPTTLGGWDWWPSPSTQRMIAYTDAGDLLKDTGGGDFTVTLKSGMSTSAYPMFVEGGKEAAANNRKLFMFNGINVVQVLSGDGATTSDIATPPADWTGGNQPTFGVNHENRIWAGGNSNDPHRMYYSLATNHEDFTTADAGTITVYPGEGEKLVWGLSFKGFLILGKYPRGIYVIDTTDPTIANWKVRRLNTSTSGVSPLSAIISDDDIVFIDSNGQFQFLSAVQEFGDVSSRNLSKIADLNVWMRDNINFSRLDKCQAVWYPKKREARFALTKTGSTINDIQVIIDFNRPDLPRFRFSDQNTCESLWLRLESDNTFLPVCGDDAGFVWKLDNATRSKDGVGFQGIFQTPHDDFRWKDEVLASKRKIGQFLELVVEPKGNWNIDADVYWDDELENTYTFNMGSTGATLGSFVLDTDVLAGTSVLNTKRRITGSGKRFSLIGKNSGVGEDYSISKFLLYFALGDEKN